MREPFVLAGTQVPAGTRSIIDVPLPNLSSQAHMNMRVHVVHGKKPGPVLFLSAAVHGDELNGIEIIRNVLSTNLLSRIKGTVIAVPVVNAYGVIQLSRYLPDRRDLNRSFPGNDRGSLAARLARLFMDEIVSVSTHGIDLHTGSGHRTNLPQIRANLDDADTMHMAQAFGAPVILNATFRDGSLRQSASELGVKTLVYEAGEAMRYNDIAIRAGVMGAFNVMRALSMLPPVKRSKLATMSTPFIARSSSWVRTAESGMYRASVKLGDHVARGDLIGYVTEASDGIRHEIRSTKSGVVIGRLELPMVHEGDAIIHLARFKGDVSDIVNHVESFHEDHSVDDQLGVVS